MGIGLAMDASCVSMTNGLTEKNMKLTKIIFISLLFGIFQALMPVLGYFLGGFFSKYIQKFIPLIALIVLSILGGKMIIETLREKKHNIKITQEVTQSQLGSETEQNGEQIVDTLPAEPVESIRRIKGREIFIQAIATSIDAFSIGVLYISETVTFAMLSFMIFGIVTMLMCIAAVFIGKKFGILFKDKAGIIGGLILIAVGLKIFIEYLIETI